MLLSTFLIKRGYKSMSRGGKRKGAGRPKNAIPTAGVKYMLPLEYKHIIQGLGGSKWIKEQVLKYLDNK
jgi:hypothetical protein|tara:strand:- start:324 stop:530 length:207 start_codon:yes stop_codon:yes gene_type:complete